MTLSPTAVANPAAALAEKFEARAKYHLANASRGFQDTFDYLNVRLDRERAALWAQAALDVRESFTDVDELPEVYATCDVCGHPIMIGENLTVDPHGDFISHVTGECRQDG